jgi:hypothetical protein
MTAFTAAAGSQASGGDDYYLQFFTHVASNFWYFQFLSETQQLNGNCELLDENGSKILLDTSLPERRLHHDARLSLL